MNILKKILGIVWIILGIFAAYYIAKTLAIPKIETGKPEDLIAAIIYMFLIPIISLSLVLFGTYSLMGEYSESNM